MIAPVVPEGDLDDVPGIIRDYKSISRYGVTPELHKGLLEAYYASVSYMDAQVGRVLDALDELGLRENTIVIFSSDHGYLLGHHNKFQKQHLFEEATRVPFILSVPWMKDTHGEATGHLTELIDLYPTVAELAGLTPPKGLPGTSLVPLLENPSTGEWSKDLVFTISRSGGESIRTADWRFTHWGFGEKGEELFDRKNDPGEFTNLAKNPEYAAKRKELKALLEKITSGCVARMAGGVTLCHDHRHSRPLPAFRFADSPAGGGARSALAPAKANDERRNRSRPAA
jgi:arylsulfatase A-like enzyme